jgi:2'-5' RNA ligase
MDKIRCFIALELSDEIRSELSRMIDILKRSDADVKWMKPGSIHLTLKFLGYVDEEKIPVISGRLKDIASGAKPFDVTLGGIGVFPKWEYVKVLWVGLDDRADRVKELAGRTEDIMSSEGFEREERAFSPHLTLGRVRTAKRKKELKELADSIKVNPSSSRISKVVLFKSELTPHGAIYTELASAGLTG